MITDYENTIKNTADGESVRSALMSAMGELGARENAPTATASDAGNNLVVSAEGVWEVGA